MMSCSTGRLRGNIIDVESEKGYCSLDSLFLSAIGKALQARFQHRKYSA